MVDDLVLQNPSVFLFTFLILIFVFLDGKRLMVNENSIRSQADIDADLKVIYGDARYVPNY